MSFQQTSAFDKGQPGYRTSFGRFLERQAELQKGSTKKLDVVEVPYDQLERWYRELDALGGHAAGRYGSKGDSDLLKDIRDEVYAYLR
jgi:hypothetical protein